jgi:membrane-bound hydrogenase subunit beta
VERLTPQAIVDSFRKELGKGFISGSVYEREVAVKKNKFRRLWVEVKRSAFRGAIKHIFDLQEYPHFVIISSSDLGAEVELIYHFTVYYGHHLEELSLGIRVKLPKSDLTIPTITDLIPGAIFMERETQEMMGVKVVNIPDGRRLFVSEDVPEGIYPWRKDEAGPQKLLRVLPGRLAKKQDKEG